MSDSNQDGCLWVCLSWHAPRGTEASECRQTSVFRCQQRKEKGAGSIGVLRAGSAGPLFEGSGPLRAQKGVQRLENEHFVLQVLLDPFLEDLEPWKAKKGSSAWKTNTLYFMSCWTPFWKIWTLETPKRGPAAPKRTYVCTCCCSGGGLKTTDGSPVFVSRNG